MVQELLLVFLGKYHYFIQYFSMGFLQEFVLKFFQTSKICEETPPEIFSRGFLGIFGKISPQMPYVILL